MRFRKNSNNSESDVYIYNTNLSIFLCLLAICVVGIMGLKHYDDLDSYGEAWGKFALLQATLGSIGLILQTVINKGLKIKRIDKEVGLYGIVVAVVLMTLQVVSQTLLSVSTTEKMFYFLFASICEEIFFRGFLMYAFIKIANKNIAMIIFGILFQSFLFMMLHQNYYYSPALMITVFISGTILGIVFVLKKDITINIIAHAIVNLIAVGQWSLSL
jgi:membrane protease YdiL (CAAX protease family)